MIVLDTHAAIWLAAVALEQARRDPAHLGAGLYFVLSKAMPKPSSDRDISIGFLLVLDRDLELRARSHGGDEPVAGRHG